ncbi:hypothetical protein Tco_0968010 [Tanacetum coccineum]
MSTRSTLNELVSPFSNPERVVRNRQRNHGDPSLLLDFEDINMNHNNQGRPPMGHIPPPIPPPIPQSHGPLGPNLHNPVPDLRTMEELCAKPTQVYPKLPGVISRNEIKSAISICENRDWHSMFRDYFFLVKSRQSFHCIGLLLIVCQLIQLYAQCLRQLGGNITQR